ncbi:helix-turn-helix transcriptional regulator [Streptomyces sp. NPDC004959]|uniref:helix-turn-helix domain-containing protein n=2 Tax=Streptomyces TaxID=1883 RepID=UPI0004C9FAD7|nr:helix-turn-helix transcriptional regulator [Streptomyces sp. NRRL F-5630]
MAMTYGQWLRGAREAKGWSQDELAARAFMSRSMITAIETDRRIPSETDAMALDAALGTGNVLVTFRPKKQNESFAAWFEAARQFEKLATIIREYAPTWVPGFLQTEAYATAVLDVGYPRQSEERRHGWVVSRLERARLLDDPVTPEVWVVLDEAVIRRPVGGYEVMAEQLEHLVDLSESGRIRVHIVPFGKVPYPALDGQMSLMWFKDQPPLAYTEGLRVGLLHDDPAMVTELQSTYDLSLGEALALTPSIALMREQAREFRKRV